MNDRLRTVDWRDDALVLIDQNRIPHALEYVQITTPEETIQAIKQMTVRGAPAIGGAGAYGVALAVAASRDLSTFEQYVSDLRNARPTAVNLMWAVDRVAAVVRSVVETDGWLEANQAAVREADKICEEDIRANDAISEYGWPLIPEGGGVITHCNTGDLATVSGGTAFGVLRKAKEQGRSFTVWADETRPRLQGLRLTAWELGRAGVDVRVIPDGAAAFLMACGQVQMAIVGADRVAANGDIANKIGTYSLAVNCKAHSVPFYVAAPVSTIDPNCPSGENIPIEQRNEREILDAAGLVSAPEGSRVYNPAFDVTPGELISGIITERGILRPDYQQSIRRVVNEGDMQVEKH